VQHLKIFVEPGRSLVAPYGIIVSRVVQSKVTGKHRWLVLDAGMNDLTRPALYQAHHRIEPLDRPPSPGVGKLSAQSARVPTTSVTTPSATRCPSWS
jgi:diaminopimelate decarboxylase